MKKKSLKLGVANMELCSPTTLELIKALVNAQKDMPGVAKEGTNPRFGGQWPSHNPARLA